MAGGEHYTGRRHKNGPHSLLVNTLFHSTMAYVLLSMISLLALLPSPSQSCMIQGTDSGYCEYRYHPMYYNEKYWIDGNMLGELRSDAEEMFINDARKGKADFLKEERREAKKLWRESCDSDGPECMGYCGSSIFLPASGKSRENHYVPCVPRDQTLPPDLNFPEGRFTNHTVRTKDTWIRDFVKYYVEERIKIENNVENEDNGVDEYGRKGATAIRFSKIKDCEQAFKAYACYVNFPRCDTKTNESLPMCKSTCENLFKSCDYPEQMWRCGHAMYFNSQDEDELIEVPSGDPSKAHQDQGYARIKNDKPYTKTEAKFGRNWNIRQGYGRGNNTIMRDFFPGQPFRKENCRTINDEELCIHSTRAVCTPHFRGSATRTTLGLGVLALAAVSVLLAW